MARGITTPNRLDVSVGVSGAGAVAYGHIKTCLKAAGWVVEQSGDGSSTYDPTGDTALFGAITSWYVIRQPAAVAGSTRRFCIQVITTSNTNQFRIKYSLNAAFSGGSPSATQVPSATGEIVLVGGGTDASPTGGRVWSDGVGGTHRCIGIADGAAPYGFMFFHTRTDSNTDSQEGRFGFDPVHVPEDIDHSADTDPYVLHVGGLQSWQVTSLSALSFTTSSVEPGTGRNHDGTYSRYCLMTQEEGGGTTNINFPDTSTTTGNSAALPQDQWSVREALVPLAYANLTSGIKGVSTLIHGVQTDDANVLATRFKLYNNAGESNAYIRVGAYALPWAGGSAPASGSWSSVDADIWYFGETPPDAGDEDAPTITLISPSDGQIYRNTPIVVDVEDESAISLAAILARFPSGRMDVVHTGFVFGEFYRSSTNVRESLDGGLRYRFTLLRDSGWREAPTLEFLVRDAGGNVAVVTV